MRQPFEADPEEILNNPSAFVPAVIQTLQSNFMIMPRGDDFVTYPVFEEGYQALRKATKNFWAMDASRIIDEIFDSNPMVLVVLRTILGFSPPEWAYEASERTGIRIPENYARSIDKRIRANPDNQFRVRDKERIESLVKTACELIKNGVPSIPKETLHRLDKADTARGLDSLQQVSSMHIPYPMLLYERLLGRPFATHRDAVSEKVADLMELPIEDMLTENGIPYRKTKRAERIPGFDQAPDFIIPDEYNPKITIEAKITEDGGTARDKITRVQRLALMNMERKNKGEPPFEVIACIDGRGFVRTSDIEKLITYTNGKVFTLDTLEFLISNTNLKAYSIE